MTTCDGRKVVGVTGVDVAVALVGGTDLTGELVGGVVNVVETPTPTCNERGSATAEPDWANSIATKPASAMALPPSQSNHIGRPEDRRATLRDSRPLFPRGCTDINVPLELLAIQVGYRRRFIVCVKKQRPVQRTFHQDGVEVSLE